MNNNKLCLKIIDKFNESDFQFKLYQNVVSCLKDTKLNFSDSFVDIIENILENNQEVNQELDNFLFTNSYDLIEESQNVNSSEEKDPEDSIYQSQVLWEKRVLKSINAMCSEFQIPLLKHRLEKDIKEMKEKWPELSTLGKDVGSVRPVYSPKDFLEVLVKLKNHNSQVTSTVDADDWLTNWGLIQLPLPTKSLQELRIQFHELSIGQHQIGVDDTDKINHQFEVDHQNIAKLLIDSKNSAACQEFAKSGCQLEYRRQLWYQILNIDIKEADRSYYHQLKQSVLEYDLLVDSLLFMDVKLTAANDDAYFVFEDYLYQILLPLSRDATILKIFDKTTASPPKVQLSTRTNPDINYSIYPPSGLIPFHGFSMLAVPLCYFIDDPVELYYVFRLFYLRYFHKLFIISYDPQGILSLCVLFESLLQALEPDLFYYLKNIGIQPLRLAFKWIMRAFSGYLATDQVLLLWDRILAYDSLELLPLLAVAIMQFRKANLSITKSTRAAEAVLADLSTLQIIPLIQLTLFSN